LQGIPSQSYERIGEPGGVIPLEKLIIKKSEGGEPLSKSRGGFIANSLKPGAYAQGGPVDTSTARAQLAKLKAA
jgi:hypothetical protein